MIVGVTGSLAALGDTLFPASSLGHGAGAGLFRPPAGGWCAGGGRILRHGVCGQHLSDLDIRARGSSVKVHWDNRGLSALVLDSAGGAVYVLGVMDVLLLAPLWLQVAHLLGADLLWAALVVLTARLTLVPVETP
jgi:cytochrome c oxidase assembly protein subunit 15